MTRSRVILLLATLSAGVFWPTAATSAPAPRQLVGEAEQAFNNGDYATALARYRQIAQEAPYAPDVLYNLGTIHARQGDRGRATWRYLQALQLDPRDRSLLHNLALVDPDLQQDLSVTPIPPLNAVYWWLTANEWAALATGSTMLGLLLLALYYWLAPQRPIRLVLRRLAALACVAAVLAWPPAFLHYHQEKVLWRGVVVADGTVAHTDPSAKAFATFALPTGKVVRILDQSTPGWLKIAFADDRIGFVQRDRIEFL
jgi:tetratricopeptide (TPR) repeat protein